MSLFSRSADGSGSAGILSRPPDRRIPAGNTATGILKIIALAFMMIDHCGKVLCNDMPEMRILGRAAFPIYVWCAVVGACYTRSMPKYLTRMLLVGLISQPLYNLALNHTWQQPNIFLTLVLGLCAIWGIREKKAGSQIWAPVAAIILATVLNAVYNWRGVLLFVLLWAVRDSRSGIAAVMVAFFLFWGSSYSATSQLFGIPLRLSELPAALSRPLTAFFRLETYALLSLPFILIPFRKDWHYPRWVGYLMYPAHLAVIILLRKLMGV